MKNFSLKSAVETVFSGLLVVIVLSGCAASHSVSRSTASDRPTEASLHGFLDRWDLWNSYAAHMKLKLSVNDSTFKARGHILYLVGERYEVGFAKPYNQLLGNLYISPDQVVYWGANSSPAVYTANDTICLTDIFQTTAPNWNPRDLLPFPVAGRSAGFQVDSLDSGKDLLVHGHSDDASYSLTITHRSGSVSTERIKRNGYDPVIKYYSRYQWINGWPLARRIVCQDTSGSVTLIWYLSDIALDAAPQILGDAIGNESTTGTSHE